MKKALYPIIILILSTAFIGCSLNENLEDSKLSTSYNENISINTDTVIEETSEMDITRDVVTADTNNDISSDVNINSKTNVNTETKSLSNFVPDPKFNSKSEAASKTREDTEHTSQNLKYNNSGIPVLMYHSVKYEKGNPVRISKENFSLQMKYLNDNNYTTLSLNELYEFMKNNVPVPKNSVVLTFDDGYKDNYETAYPILKQYGFKATIFVITDYIGKGEYLTEEEIKELDENGIHIESHTVYHEDLSTLSYEKQLDTLKNSKHSLEKLLNKEINYIAYPYGKHNKNTLKAAEKAGYKLALTTAGRWSDKSDGILTLDRVYISGFHSLDTFIERITNPEYSF